MSQYTHRVTIACPIAHVDVLNQLSGAWGLNYADASYFGDANFQDSGGNLYCVRSTACTEDWLTRATSGGVTRPAWDAEAQQLDLAQAEEAKALLVIANTEVVPDKITCFVGNNTTAAIQTLGLTLIPTEEEN